MCHYLIDGPFAHLSCAQLMTAYLLAEELIVKNYIVDYWYRFREAVLTPARIVPLVQIGVGAAASYVVALAAKNGLNLDQGLAVAFASPVILGAIGTALHWQVGQRANEKALTDFVVGKE